MAGARSGEHQREEFSWSESARRIQTLPKPSCLERLVPLLPIRWPPVSSAFTKLRHTSGLWLNSLALAKTLAPQAPPGQAVGECHHQDPPVPRTFRGLFSSDFWEVPCQSPARPCQRRAPTGTLCRACAAGTGLRWRRASKLWALGNWQGSVKRACTRLG